MQPMRQMKYEVKFLTPAFLGNAEQSGQWRTPPFKALLRQWWRVAVAAAKGGGSAVRSRMAEERQGPERKCGPCTCEQSADPSGSLERGEGDPDLLGKSGDTTSGLEDKAS
ncbi:MAG: hypothetical protein J4F38_12235 [Pseudomonadales bacterium]|nr:hypothetical protein [Pseudomonadales bacterium]